MIFSDDTIDVFLQASPIGLFIGLERKTDENLRANLRHWKEILDKVETELRSTGVTQLLSVVGSEAAFKFCKHFGFQSAYVVFDDTHELMRKDIG